MCGTPGTGKKSVAPVLAKALKVPLVSINDYVRGGEGAGEVLADVRALRRALLRSAPRGSVVYGHLLPHVLRRGEVRLVAVLRCEPKVLSTRLRARGYGEKKLRENVEAELIGVLLDECVRTFGEGLVREYDTTSATPTEVARSIQEDVRSKTGRARPAEPWIDWTLRYDSSRKLTSLLGRDAAPAST